MCTVVVWADSGQAVISSRNMDWFGSMDSKLWVVPAGREVDGAGPGDPNPLKWTSKYGSVITSVFDIGSADGLNEKGLAAHMLWLTPSDYGSRDASRAGLSLSLWAQYYLDNFATVAEAVADCEANPYQILDVEIEGGEAVVHLQISDATGDVAVIESVDGKIVFTHGEQYTTLTNKPVFAQQLANLRNYEGFGGTKELPGTTSSEDRFVRASLYRSQLPTPDSTKMAIAELLSVLRDAAQPFGAASRSQPNIASTIWRTTCDHTNLRYIFESMYTPYMVWLDLKNLDFTPGAPVKVLDMTEMADRIGEQSQFLTDTKLFTFSEPAETK